jgi:predicted dehydrogenase
MLARADVDAVSVCLPNFLHAPVALAALKGGKHVLSEKPPTMTAAEAGEIVDEAARRTLVYMYITQRRYSAEADEAARLIASGRLGDVYHAEAAWRRTSGIPIGAGGWFVDKARSGGGAFIDIGVHMLDIAWFLLGCPRPVCVQGAMHSRFGHAVPAGTKYDVDDFGAALISLEGGKTILVQASWALQQEKDEHYAKVYGTKGGLDFSPFTVYSTSETGQTVERPRLMRVDGFSANVGHFVDVVRGEAEPRTKAVHALHLMQMLEGAYASAAGARAVTVRP